LVDVLCRLQEHHPVLDVDDLNDLECQDVHDLWRQWAFGEVLRGLGDRGRTCGPHWSAPPWTGCNRDRRLPEHDGYQVRWDFDRLLPAFAARLLPAFAARLLAEFRRSWRRRDRYHITPIAAQWLGGPSWQVSHDGQVVAVARSRHAAWTGAGRRHLTGRPGHAQLSGPATI
jgi:hypothetical protein